MKNPRCSKTAASCRLQAAGRRCNLKLVACGWQQGFSLIELLIASLVIAAASALLVGGLVAANRSSELWSERLLFTQVLASRLALLDDELSDQTPTHGILPAPLEDVSWTLAWTDAPLAPLVQATLSVSRKDHAADVVTYRRLATEP